MGEQLRYKQIPQASPDIAMVDKSHTGLPDQLKSGIESLSGMSMDHVKVHYHSSKPAQLQAHAYAQGTDIHIGPGQERHLPHEAWHVVQQKQGRVNATKQLKGDVPVNDDAGLEKEADVMGEKALQTDSEEPAQLIETGTGNEPAQLREIDMGAHGRLEIGDFASGLSPDNPAGYGGTGTLLGDKVASSMEMLVTPNHEQGSSPSDQNTLFSKLPTIGKYKLPANGTKPKTGSNIYIKGHLLNDNLGGPGKAPNLYPITHQANVDHDNLVEEPIKEWVNKRGGIVHYKVNTTFKNGGHTDVKDESSNNLAFVDAQFTIDVNALTNKGVKSVASGKSIDSVWGNTNNGGKINFAEEPVAAPAFAADKVKLPPRTQIKKDWDDAYFQIGQHLAHTTKVSVDTWLKTIKGIGPASVKALKDNIDEATLNKSGKATLTKARGLLKQFIDEKYSFYLQVTGGHQDEEAALDAGDISLDDVTTTVIQTNIQNVGSTLDELDLLISQLKGLSLGSDDGSASSGGAFESPFYVKGSYGKESTSKTRELPENCLQGDVFVEFRDFCPVEPTSKQELIEMGQRYIRTITPRVNPQKLGFFLEHARRSLNMQVAGIGDNAFRFDPALWRRITFNLNTTAVYYDANFPEGVFNTSWK